jgi:hypothetical protein
VESIPVRHVGQAVERAAIGYREKDVVVARECQARSKAAECRLIDAGLRIVLPTNLLAGQAGFVEILP